MDTMDADVAALDDMDGKFWTTGHLMALGAREIVKRHAADMAAVRTELAAVCQERDALRARVADAESERDTSADMVDGMDAANTALRAELAALKAERDKYRESSAKAYVEAEDLRAELAALRQPGVRVPVRFNTSADELRGIWKESSGSDDLVSRLKDYLAANATIAVLPGVPPLDELVKAGQASSMKVMEKIGLRASDEYDTAYAAAIRDRVIAALASEDQSHYPPDAYERHHCYRCKSKIGTKKCCPEASPGSPCAIFLPRKVAALAPRPLPSREEVAWALRGAYWKSIGLEAPTDKVIAKEYMAEADAVLALFAGCQPVTLSEAREKSLAQLSEAREATREPAPREWSDDQIEALARVLRAAFIKADEWDSANDSSKKWWRDVARAAVAFMRAEPPAASVDPDAWKTPLALKDMTGGWLRVEQPTEYSMLAITESAGCCISPAAAASLALWAASYANAHGCPVDVRGNLQLIGVDSAKPGSEGTVTPPAYASPTLLLSSITAAGMEMTVGECIKLLESTEADLQRAIRALVRAGFQDLGGEEWKPPLGQQPHFAWNGPTRAEAEAKWLECQELWDSGQKYTDWLLPQLPESRTPVDGLPKLQDGIAVESRTPIAAPEPLGFAVCPKSYAAGRDDAIAAAPEPVAAPETLEALAEILRRAMTGGECSGKPSRNYEMGVAAILRAAQAYYSPRGNDLDMLCKTYGHDSQRFRDHINSRIRYRVSVPPVGWTLDVTWQEMQQWLEPDSIGRRPSPQCILDLCRSRIQPVFECKECAGWKEKADQHFKDFCSRAEKYDALKLKAAAARAALEGE